MAVPPELIAALQARTSIYSDSCRARQEELPLSNEDKRGLSYIPPRFDESQNYHPRIKQDLNNKWSAVIVDAESEQMQGLTNLNARPWAETSYQPATRFEIPKVAPAPQAVSRAAAPAAPVAAPAPAQAPPPPPPAKPPQNTILDTGKCQVSMQEGRIVVPDASFCVAISVHNDAAFFMLTAPGKPHVCLNVLKVESPVIYGTSCIIKTVAPANQPVSVYTVKPLAPSTADKLARVLESVQIALRKTLNLPAPKPAPTPATAPSLKPTAKTFAPKFTPTPPTKSLLCADSPDSSPEASPRFRSRQLVDVVAKKPDGKSTISLDEVINNINVIVRTAYFQITGCSVPVAPVSSGEQPSDVALAEWLNKGHLDSDADETRRGLIDILRFLRDLQLKNAAARGPPIMSSQTMEVFKSLDRSIKSPGERISYSAPEIMHLKNAAIVPEDMSGAVLPEMKSKKALAVPQVTTLAIRETKVSLPPAKFVLPPVNQEVVMVPSDTKPAPQQIKAVLPPATQVTGVISSEIKLVAQEANVAAVSPPTQKPKKGLSSSMWAR
ncbi:hypothetical protein NLG97_g9561 [Lecanicillium saksenae]|uniref:Uncharacterized protein n=1 Tax=Lecanicillium saksenae TaxID=468837 RepID=A0ACC1QFV9_9HYPO|nr:hypothetical protein NLG97_g9561 [Lecanicillium saksenae]